MNLMYWWVGFNGLFWPALAVMFTCWWSYKQGKKSRAIAENKLRETVPQLTEDITKELLKYIPTTEDITDIVQNETKAMVDKKIGGEISGTISSIASTDEWQDVIQNNDITDLVNTVNQKDSGEKAIHPVVQRLVSGVVKGLEKKTDKWIQNL